MTRLLPLAALLLVPALAAAEMPREARWVPAAYFDVLSPGNQIQHLRSATNNVCATRLAQGVGCDASFSTTASVGARAGMYYETEDYRWGGSFGILTGGPDRGTWSTSLTGVAGGARYRTTSTVFRFLGEASQKFLITDDWYGNIGAGLGLAMTNETTTCYATGALGTATGPCYAAGGTRNLGWLAWEIFPAIQYQELEFGLRYSGMGRGGHFAPWNTFGLSAGWHFQ